LPTNSILQEQIAHLLARPVGRRPKDIRVFHASFSYQAASWSKPRHIVTKLEWRPGEPCASSARQMAAENGVRSPNQADEQEESLCTVPDQGQTPRRAPFVLLSQVKKAVIREMSVCLHYSKPKCKFILF
jgi:hypothetical protein